MTDYENKFRSCMLGLAICDALGMPCEDYSQFDLAKKFGRITDYLNPPEGQFNYGKLKAGMYTDDTEQAIILAESLVANNGLDVNHFANKLLGEYGRNVVEHPEIDRWTGRTFKKAVKNYISNLPANKCGVKAKSCGSAMRVAPIGLIHVGIGSIGEILVDAAKSSRVTHLGAETTAAAQTVALYVNLATGSINTETISEIAIEQIGKESKLVAKRIKKAYELRAEKPEKVIKILGDSGLARETVPTAIYSFNHSPYNFEEAVLTAVNMGGDTDSRAAITGAISGAFRGFHNIPERWVEKLENHEKLAELSDNLWKTRCAILDKKLFRDRKIDINPSFR
jgi:ADP-ribosylglycohydrolase